MELKKVLEFKREGISRREINRRDINENKKELYHYKVEVYNVRNDKFGENSFIINTPASKKILMEPWLVGKDLISLAQMSSRDFLRAAYSLVPELKNATYNTIAQVVPLAGALYYRIADAFEEEFGEALNQCFVGAKRVFCSEHQKWETELSYLNFEALAQNSVLLIGDTIATGGTIRTIIKAAVTAPHATPVKAVIIYSIAGSAIGAQYLAELSNEIGVPIYTFFSNALFGVEKNGTDMPWLHPDTILPNGTKEEVIKQYGKRLGREWCSVWDWGERAKDPYKHLSALLERIRLLLKSPDYAEENDRLQKFYTKTKQAAKKRSELISLINI